MTAPANNDEVGVEDHGGVRTITLNRPQRLNALVPSMMESLAACVAQAAADSHVGCVVLTGSGRGFCAGGDLEGGRAATVNSAEAGSPIEQGQVRLRGYAEASRLLHDMPKPTIAMINGPVAGAGIGLAGACDLRFAGESAVFASAFSRIGASGDFGSTWFWSKILGSGRARELFLLDEKLDARQALSQGIYTKVFADDVLREETMAIAKRLADGPRMGWRYLKANLNYAEDGQFEAALDQEALHMGLSIRASALARQATSDKPKTN